MGPARNTAPPSSYSNASIISFGRSEPPNLFHLHTWSSFQQTIPFYPSILQHLPPNSIRQWNHRPSAPATTLEKPQSCCCFSSQRAQRLPQGWRANQNYLECCTTRWYCASPELAPDFLSLLTRVVVWVARAFASFLIVRDSSCLEAQPWLPSRMHRLVLWAPCLDAPSPMHPLCTRAWKSWCDVESSSVFASSAAHTF